MGKIEIKNTKDIKAHKVKVLVYGMAGSGKTYLISTLKKPFVISAEGGLLSIRGKDIDYVEIKSIEELVEVYYYCKETKTYDWIVLDSISEIAEILLSEEKKKTKDPRQAYGVLFERMTAIIRSFRDLPHNVYFSAKADRIQDESGSLYFSPSIPGSKTAPTLPYFFRRSVSP